MTVKPDTPDPVRRVDAFDWRAGRTWLVFLGSAFCFGAGFMGSMIATRGMVRGGLVLSDWGGLAIETLVMLTILFSALYAVARLARADDAARSKALILYGWNKVEGAGLGRFGIWFLVSVMAALMVIFVARHALGLEIPDSDGDWTLVWVMAGLFGPAFYIPLLQKFAAPSRRGKPT